MTTPFDPNADALAIRNTVTELCAAWTVSAAEITKAFSLIVGAQDRLHPPHRPAAL